MQRVTFPSQLGLSCPYYSLRLATRFRELLWVMSNSQNQFGTRYCLINLLASLVPILLGRTMFLAGRHETTSCFRGTLTILANLLTFTGKCYSKNQTLQGDRQWSGIVVLCQGVRTPLDNMRLSGVRSYVCAVDNLTAGYWVQFTAKTVIQERVLVYKTGELQISLCYSLVPRPIIHLSKSPNNNICCALNRNFSALQCVYCVCMKMSIYIYVTVCQGSKFSLCSLSFHQKELQAGTPVRRVRPLQIDS